MVRTPAAGIARSEIIQLRMTPRERAQLLKQASSRGFTDRSNYLRWLVSRDGVRLAGEVAPK